MSSTTKIVDLNYDCLLEIMEYSTVENIMKMELAVDRCRPLTHRFYEKCPFLQINLALYQNYPNWMWRKLGKSIVNFKLIDFDAKNLERLLSCLTSAQGLCFERCDMTMASHLPDRLQRLILRDVTYDDETLNTALYKVSPNLIEVELSSLKSIQWMNYCIDWHRLTKIKRLTIPYNMLESIPRSILEQLECIHLLGHCPEISTQILASQKLRCFSAEGMHFSSIGFLITHLAALRQIQLKEPCLRKLQIIMHVIRLTLHLRNRSMRLNVENVPDVS